MGLLQTADAMVDNSIKELNDVLNSQFTTYLQGAGTPVLVTYYNLNDTMTTLNSGTLTPDQYIGKNSPLRYNKIKNFPVYGLKEFIPSRNEIDAGLQDLTLDIEITILPNTIKPSAFDYIVYEFLDTNYVIMFQIDDFEFSSIKSNNYYKLNLSLRDVNSYEIIDQLESQIVKNMSANLDTIGTNDKCILEDDIHNTIIRYKEIVNEKIEQYLDVFYNERFNALMMNYSVFGYPIYDPFLSEFVVKNKIMDNYKNNFIVLINYDDRFDVPRMYNKTLYRYIEKKDITNMEKLTMAPVKFQATTTNPFSYYGEGRVFTLDVMTHPQPPYNYINPEFIDRLMNYQLVRDEDSHGITKFWNIILNFIHKGNLFQLISEDDLKNIHEYSIDYEYDDFIFIPILIFIMKEYIMYLNNN